MNAIASYSVCSENTSRCREFAIENIAGQNTINLPITLGSACTTVVQAGTLQLGPNAQAAVLGNGGAADIQGGKLVFDYTGISDPAGAISTALTDGYNLPTKFSSGKLRDTTAPASGLILGWADNGVNQVTVMATYAGDFNLDGQVDLSDLEFWKANFGLGKGAIFAQADSNYDGQVDLSDLELWKATFGASV